jgi:hypothetical protein
MTIVTKLSLNIVIGEVKLQKLNTAMSKEAEKLSRQLSSSVIAVIISDMQVTAKKFGVIVSRDTFNLLQYLANGSARRSAYRRFVRKTRNGVRTVRGSKELCEALRLSQADLEGDNKGPSDLESARIYISNAEAAPKAVIIPWIEYSLLGRFIAIHSRAAVRAELSRSAADRRFEITPDNDFLVMLKEKEVRHANR